MSQQTTVKQHLELTRSVFGAFICFTATITLIALGYSMDDANFPGSNLAFSTTTASATTDGGELIGNPESGWSVFLPATCTNIYKSSGATQKPPCYTDADGVVGPLMTGTDANDLPANGPFRGWIVSNNCMKEAGTSTCAPFAGASILGMAGTATFALFALQAILYGAHTALALNDDPRNTDDDFTSETNIRDTLSKPKQVKFRTLFVLNIVWSMLSCFLFVWSAIAWQGMCDKLDTGLGRVVDQSPFDPANVVEMDACTTNYCTIPFSGFMWSYAVSFIFFAIPRILILSGFTADASYKEVIPL